MTGKIDKPQAAAEIVSEIGTLYEGWQLSGDEKQRYKNELAPQTQQRLKAYQQHLRAEQERWAAAYKKRYKEVDDLIKKIFEVKTE